MRLWIAGVLGLSACRSPASSDVPTDTAPTDTAVTQPDDGAHVNVLAIGPNGVRMMVDLEESDAPTLTCVLDDAPPVWRQLVPFGAEWAWLPGADLPSMAWIDPSFDDSAWPRAELSLGYGEEVRTPIDPQKSNLWLRTTFVVDDPAAVEEAMAWYRRDDGVVFWVNGTPILRDNAPEGTIDETTHAVESTSGQAAEKALHSASLPLKDVLRPGVNVLAVALLEASSYYDASFDLRLAARMLEPPDPNERHVVRASEPDVAHEITVRGLLSGATYTCTATTASGARSAPETIDTPPLDPPAPPLALLPGSASGPWYTLLNHQRPCANDYVNRLYIVDADGRARWAYDTLIRGRSSIDIEATLLDPERILFGGGDQPNGRPKIVDLDRNVLHESAFPGVDDVTFHHDVAMDGDDIMGLHTADVVGAKTTAEGFGLVVYDPDTQKVSWRWDTQGALDAGRLPDPGKNSDAYHANAFSQADDADGTGIYVSLLKQDWVIRIDRTTGDVTWRLGLGGDFTLLDAEGNPLPDDAWFDTTHGLKAYDGNRVWLYNNGHNGHQSEAVALTLDPVARTATVDWRWTEFSWFEPIWGDVDELPNGNAAITMAHARCFGGDEDHLGSVLELDPATQEVLWRLDFLDPDDSTYRSQRIDGCDVFANEAFCPSVGGR